MEEKKEAEKVTTAHVWFLEAEVLALLELVGGKPGLEHVCKRLEAAKLAFEQIAKGELTVGEECAIERKVLR